ncbi:MAG: hypothetical protein WBM48_01405 [Polyangiales bacterium]
MALDAPDAIFMAQHRNPAVGRPEIETACRDVFAMIRLDIKFEIEESSDWRIGGYLFSTTQPPRS